MRVRVLSCRDAVELPEAIRDYVEKLVAPYFRAVVDWYELVGHRRDWRRIVLRLSTDKLAHRSLASILIRDISFT